jgi:hypothetical protein
MDWPRQDQGEIAPMPKSALRLLRVGIVAIGVLILCMAAKGEGAQERAAKDIPEGLQLVPRLGISAEYGGFIVQQENYASMLRRRLEVDVLQYRRHILYLDFDEKTFFGIPGNAWGFNLMKYDITLGGYRYDFGNFYLGLFLHHQCNNPIHTTDYHIIVDRERANIYMVGLEFLTKNMRIGMKDRGINFDSPDAFEFLGRFAGGLWLSKVFTRENIRLNEDFKGRLRFDILRYRRLVPYVEVGGELLIGGPTARLSPSVEVGARYHLSKFDITPFFNWTREQEALTIEPSRPAYIAKNSLLGGGRVEVMLDSETFGPTPDGEGVQLFPEIHGNADFALLLNNPNLKGHGNLELDFEALRWKPWTIFLYTDLNFYTRKEDYKPDKINYWLQYGLTYAWDRYFVEGYVKNRRRVDGNFFRGTTERSNQASLRAGTKGMKPGHYNDGISFKGNSFQWLNNWNAQASVGHYFNNRDWQYLWNLTARVRWDPLRWYIVVPYIQGDVNWMSGGGSTGDATEYAVEPGFRFHGVLDLAVYYRFQHRQNVLFFKGPSENQNLFGIRALF